MQTDRRCKPHNALYQTKDHVIPVSCKNWELFVETRCVLCCRKCNGIKEDLTLHEFKRRSGIAIFYAETLLGIRIDDLVDIEDVTVHILNHRTVVGRSIKFNGKPEVRTRVATALDFTPSSPSFGVVSDDTASKK